MPASYPGAYPTMKTPGAFLDTAGKEHDALHLQLSEELAAALTALGLSPAGSAATVRARLDNTRTAVEQIAFTPAANIDASTAAGGNYWVTLGNVTVPTWATKVYVTMTANGVQSITASSTYVLKVVLGAVSAPRTTVTQWLATGTRNPCSWTSIVTGSPTGSQSLIIHAERTAGTGQARADGTCRFDALVHFVAT